MLVSLELAAQLYAPCKTAQVVAEVVSGALYLGLVARGHTIADITVVSLALERAIDEVRKVRSGLHLPTVVEGISGQHREGEVIVIHLGLYITRPGTYHLARCALGRIVVGGLHVVVLHLGVGFHAFVFEAHAYHGAPVRAKLALHSALELNAQRGVVAVNLAYLGRQRHGRCAAQAHTGAYAHVPALQGSLYQVSVRFFGLAHLLRLGSGHEGQQQEYAE